MDCAILYTLKQQSGAHTMSTLLRQLQSMQTKTTRSRGRVELGDMQEDSIIVVKGGFGLEPAVRAVVEELDSEGKNGRSIVAYKEIGTGDSRWAYLDQVVSVEQY